MIIEYKRLVNIKDMINFDLLRKVYDLDLGFDIPYIRKERVVISPYKYHSVAHKIHTGICIEPPPMYGFILKDRSSLASKGIHILGGVIDGGYQGELIVTLTNLGSEDFIIDCKMYIAQVVLVKLPDDITFVDVIDFSETTERNIKGFGSSDKEYDSEEEEFEPIKKLSMPNNTWKKLKKVGKKIKKTLKKIKLTERKDNTTVSNKRNYSMEYFENY